MREFLSRADGRGVTITMIVNQLASEQLKVARSMVRRWLADDIARGVVERATLGFYRLRQSGDAGRRGSSE
jgi:predicted ArsR family transcriptional regulator